MTSMRRRIVAAVGFWGIAMAAAACGSAASPTEPLLSRQPQAVPVPPMDGGGMITARGP
jgi:hypothetical protein